MYFWRIERLVEDLNRDQISEWEGAKYLIMIGVVFSIATAPVFSIGMEYSWLDTVSTAIIVAATGLGTFYCYRINRRVDDRDFVLRFVCLFVPVTVRLIPVVVLVGILTGILFTESWPGFDALDEPVEPYRTAPEDLGMLVLLQVIFYWYLGRTFSRFGDSTTGAADA